MADETGAATAPTEEPPAAAPDRSWLPENLRGDETLAAFNTPDDLVKAWQSAEGVVAKRWDELDADVLDDVVRRRGVPAEADKYDLTFDEATAARVDSEGLARFQQAAHEAGLLPQQAQAMAELHLAVDHERAEAMTAAAEKRADETSAALQREWGATAPQELGNIAVVLKADAELRAALVEGGLLLPDGSFTSAPLAQALAKLGKLSREPSLVQAGGAPVTPQHAQEEISRLVQDPAYYDPSHVDHDQVVGKVTALYRQAAQGDS